MSAVQSNEERMVNATSVAVTAGMRDIAYSKFNEQVARALICSPNTATTRILVSARQYRPIP